MLKIILPLLLIGFSLPAFAQTEESSNEGTSTEVAWLNSDIYNTIRSGFDEFSVGVGYRYDYLGLGFTLLQYNADNRADWSSGRLSHQESLNMKFLNLYLFLPVGNSGVALYGTYGYEIEQSKLGNEGIGIHALIGDLAMIGVGGHAETGFQVFVGIQL